jgi:hypothetical protein
VAAGARAHMGADMLTVASVVVRGRDRAVPHKAILGQVSWSARRLGRGTVMTSATRLPSPCWGRRRSH